MNEELQREIISILRAMKEGSPDAFRVLVEQRSLYCWGQAILGVLILILAIILFRIGKWASGKVALSEREEEGPFIFLVVMCSIGCIFSFGYGFNLILSIPEALAPLGRVLEIMK